MEDLPPIDAVLISHNHFDHLDLPTLFNLGLVDVLLLWWSLGVLACFAPKESNPFASWIGEGLTISGVTIHCVPALHFSARGIFDRNKTLWRGYVIEYPESLVFFAGDTNRMWAESEEFEICILMQFCFCHFVKKSFSPVCD